MYAVKLSHPMTDTNDVARVSEMKWDRFWKNFGREECVQFRIRGTIKGLGFLE